MKTAGDGQHAVWGAQRDAAGDVPERGDVVDAVGVPDGVYSLGKRDLLRGAWRALRPVLPEGPYTDLQRVAFIDQRASDTQVWLSCDPATKQARRFSLLAPAKGFDCRLLGLQCNASLKWRVEACAQRRSVCQRTPRLGAVAPHRRLLTRLEVTGDECACRS